MVGVTKKFYRLMKRFGRYDRSVIIWIVAVISVTGVALINSPNIPGNYWKNPDVNITLTELVEHTLNSGFESSLSEIETDKDLSPFEMDIKKGYRIKNKMLDIGLVYQVNVGEKLNQEKTLREMLDILSEKYQRIRREEIKKKDNDNLSSFEESGLVYNENKSISYLNKVIQEGDEAWLFILTFDERDYGKVRDFLDSIWIKNKKGVDFG
jgi:hypothetical protein